MNDLSQQVGILFEILPGNICDVDVKPGHNASVQGMSNKNAGFYQTIYDAVPIIKSLCSSIEEDISKQNVFLFLSESMETLDHLFTGFCLGARGFDSVPNLFQQGAAGNKEHEPRNIAVIMGRIADMQDLKVLRERPENRDQEATLEKPDRRVLPARKAPRGRRVPKDPVARKEIPGMLIRTGLITGRSRRPTTPRSPQSKESVCRCPPQGRMPFPMRE